MRGLNASITVDRLLFDEALDIDLSFICAGNKDLEKVLKDTFNKNEKQVLFYDSEYDKISKKNPGNTKCNINLSKLIKNNDNYIEGFEVHLLKTDDLDSMMHNQAHEIFHVLSGLIPSKIENNKKFLMTNTDIYYDGMGCIGLFSNKGNKYYGTMYKETITDLLATAALTYNKRYSNNNISVNTIFNENYKNWNKNVNGYSKFTTLARLSIAAFSNNPDLDYEGMLNNGENIFLSSRKADNGEIIMNNDLLFGYLADPLHIKDKWEEIKGIDTYIPFVSKLDNMFDTYLKTGNINSGEIKEVMDDLTDFLNKKLDIYMRLGKLSFNDAYKIADNFNRIWREMQGEYNAYYTKKEIQKYADFKRLNYLFQTKN